MRMGTVCHRPEEGVGIGGGAALIASAAITTAAATAANIAAAHTTVFSSHFESGSELGMPPLVVATATTFPFSSSAFPKLVVLL